MAGQLVGKEVLHAPAPSPLLPLEPLEPLEPLLPLEPLVPLLPLLPPLPVSPPLPELDDEQPRAAAPAATTKPTTNIHRVITGRVYFKPVYAR